MSGDLLLRVKAKKRVAFLLSISAYRKDELIKIQQNKIMLIGFLVLGVLAPNFQKSCNTTRHAFEKFFQ